MKRVLLLAGAASLAASAPLFARGQGRGDQDRGQAAERSQGGGRPDARQGRGRAERGGGARRAQARNVQREARRDPRMMRSDRSTDVRQLRRAQDRGAAQARRDERREIRTNRENRQIRQVARQQRQQARDVRREVQIRQAVRNDRRDVRWIVREDRRDWRRFVSTSPLRILPGDERRRGWRGRDVRPIVFGARNGCPPGLARQNIWCLPPGQLRRLHAAAYNVPERYRYRFADSSDHFYRYDDLGTIYRYDRGDGLIDGVIPLYASGLLVGAPMPLGYEVYNVPLNYRPYYADGGDWLYRYDDGAIYRIDEDNGMIDAIVALLTGGVGGLGGLGVGDALPAGYDVYNVPFDHRDDYADSDDAWYRYADGSIYQVDPQTQLIEQVISLIA